jgi:antitoxin HicB
MTMAKRYTVSDGHLMLTPEEAKEGGFVVTSPFDPALFTQAESLREAFVMARDAMKTLKAARAKLARQLPREPRERSARRQVAR